MIRIHRLIFHPLIPERDVDGLALFLPGSSPSGRFIPSGCLWIFRRCNDTVRSISELTLISCRRLGGLFHDLTELAVSLTVRHDSKPNLQAVAMLRNPLMLTIPRMFNWQGKDKRCVRSGATFPVKGPAFRDAWLTVKVDCRLAAALLRILAPKLLARILGTFHIPTICTLSTIERLKANILLFETGGGWGFCTIILYISKKMYEID